MSKYKVINTVKGMREEARSQGIKAKSISCESSTGNGSFVSYQVTVHGVNYYCDGNYNKYYPISRKKYCGKKITGLRCPDCYAEAFETDNPTVAACGATPGWFFFYNKIEKKKKTEMKIVNGKLVEQEVQRKTIT